MTYIKIGERKIPAEIEIRREDAFMDKRETRTIKIADMPFDEAKELFINGLEWSVINEHTDEEGNLHSEETVMADFIIAGPLTDNRDGSITAKMGKFKTEELQEIAVATEVKSYSEAVAMREIFRKTAQFVEDDSEALVIKNLYPGWATLVIEGKTAEKAGFKFRYDDVLYKTLQNNYRFAQEYVPGEGTESLFARIDETHAGTIEDPIPYYGNMALENGKYYSEDGIIYLCARDTVNPVYNSLADLIGNYVEVV
ncbi:MAG: hypothetical protein IKL57_01110 [Oscillospiraceae bacterium]|nr:hypothetical protein [Oscillospiraceae bacterium]